MPTRHRGEKQLSMPTPILSGILTSPVYSWSSPHTGPSKPVDSKRRGRVAGGTGSPSQSQRTGWMFWWRRRRLLAPFCVVFVMSPTTPEFIELVFPSESPEITEKMYGDVWRSATAS